MGYILCFSPGFFSLGALASRCISDDFNDCGGYHGLNHWIAYMSYSLGVIG